MMVVGFEVMPTIRCQEQIMFELHPEQKLSVYQHAIEQQEQLREIERQISESKRAVPAMAEPDSIPLVPLPGRWASFRRLRQAIGGAFPHSPRDAVARSASSGGVK
jgi:hypothetical protein